MAIQCMSLTDCAHEYLARVDYHAARGELTKARTFLALARRIFAHCGHADMTLRCDGMVAALDVAIAKRLERARKALG